jgi:hypothetical protein
MVAIPLHLHQRRLLSCQTICKGGFSLFFALVDIGARRETPSASDLKRHFALVWGSSDGQPGKTGIFHNAQDSEGFLPDAGNHTTHRRIT